MSEISDSAKIRAALAEKLFKAMHGFHGLAAIGVILLAFLLWSEANQWLLIAWVMYMMGCEGLLSLLSRAYRQQRQPTAHPWLRHYAILHLMASAGWGATGILFIHGLDQIHMLLLAIFLVTVAALGMNQLSYIWRIYVVGAVITVVPATAGLIYRVGPEPWAATTGMTAALAVAILCTVAARNYDRHVHDIRDQLALADTRNALEKERLRRQEAEQRIRQREAYDSLTSTLSFTGFSEAVAERLRHGQTLIVGCINIDGFQSINNAFGMQAGDNVLRAVAKRLASLTGSALRVGRIAADEFLVLAQGDGPHVSPDGFASKLLTTLAPSVTVNEAEVELPVSIGVAQGPHDGQQSQDLIEHAVLAMRAAKASSGSSYRLYCNSLLDKVRDESSIKFELAGALQRREFQLYYQPKIDLRTDKVIGAEALLRWHSRKLGWVSPARFIPLAEASGSIGAIGDWVIEEAAAAAARLSRLFPLHLAVNVSVHQFSDGRLAECLLDAITAHGLQPQALHIEITESVFMTDPETVSQILRTVRQLGVQVALDDFGTGFSSLGYLRQMSIDYLKLDRGFVADIPNDKRQTAIVDAVISLARALGVRVVGEGIENYRQYGWLRRAGCDIGQGFLIAKPMPEDEFLSWLQTRETQGTGTHG
ncbi:hypothetical protein CAI21_04400 [Alkalilimnicola ehrlichii]|uniref:GGDEF-domain containing protein n=1 Tax=Alkalilimnicola ehrlichii TaxID=351052 RepID=A0A3E0X222_9GAMM|nr:GGDEF domain-containing phosphodiesterase [Alkalilimnicola ehrlichii]RFA30755.1 hypothetical protein CAI21_04400 [Alkalilimnicola ehrlichii]RFA38331.1 hypothetical protein CAL65_05765 [Alkalilimnicola ehrlichii]